MLNILPSLLVQLLARNGDSTAEPPEPFDLGSAIACVAASISICVLLALISLVARRARRGGQTMEDSEAAVRHYLPF